MSRAQATQVYVIIGVIFFFGVVLGFKLIYDFIETSSDIRLMEFETRLISDVERATLNPGSVNRYSYVVPYQIERVCFYDESATASGRVPDHPMVKSMMEEGKNVFLTGGFTVRSLQIENVKAPSDFYCVNVTSNLLTLMLEGKEGSTVVSSGQ